MSANYQNSQNYPTSKINKMKRRINKSHIISLNIDKKFTRLLELSKEASKHQPIIICIQDMFSRNEQSDTITTLFPGYHEHALEHEQLKLLTLTSTNETKTSSVRTYTDNGIISILATLVQQDNYHEEYIANIYIRPKATAPMVTKALSWLNNNVKNMSRLLLIGDINATGFTWDKSCARTRLDGASNPYMDLKIARGKLIEAWIGTRNLTCLNEDKLQKTYHAASGASGSSIDIAILGSKASRRWKEVSYIKSRDHGHAIMIIKTSNLPQQQQSKHRKTRTIIDINKINNSHIETIKITLKDLLSKCAQTTQANKQIDLMNKITDELCNQVKSIQYSITREQSSGRRMLNKRQAIAKKLNEQRTQSIVNKLKRLERAKSRRCNTRKRYKVLAKKREMHKKLVNKLLRAQHKNEVELDIWEQWKQIGSSNTLTCESNLITSNKDIENVAKTKFPATKRNLCNIATDNSNNPGTLPITINTTETNRAIERLRNKKYNTPEGIRMSVFYAVARQVPEVMHSIAYLSFRTCTVPRKAEFTQGTLIPKKVPGQYRIVHVSNPIAAFLETIALARLEYKLEASKLISENQYGFTALRSRHDLAARLLECTQRNKEWGKSTYIISMDIEGAFDNVNQAMLIQKLGRELNDKALTRWIASFLNNRKISIKYGQLKSQYRTVCTGVPQGSALGPVLWNFTIHDIELSMQKYNPDPQNNTTLLKYADDIYMVVENKAIELIQKGIDSFTRAIKDIDLNVRPEKCSYTIMHEHNSVLNQTIHPTINGKAIMKESTINVLGIKLNNECRVNREDRTLIHKLTQTAHTLNKLKRTRIVKSCKQWRTLINGLIISRTISNYWPALINKPSDREWIMKLILKVTKIAFDWPASAPNKPIKLILDLREPMTIINKMVTERLHLEASPSYKYLARLGCKLKANIVRRYANPDRMLSKVTHYNADNNDTWTKEFWYILEGGRYSAMAKITNDRIEPQYLSSSWYDACSYTNTLTTLSRAASEQTLSNITLLINEKCSILQALHNWDNHDQRIIQLRESINQAGWNIVLVSGEYHKTIKNAVKVQLKESGVQTRPGDLSHSIDEIIRLNTTETRPMGPRTLVSMPEKNPDMMDYLVRLLASKDYLHNAQIERLSNRTTICKSIETDPAKWMRINPNQLKGDHLLMLGGIIKDSKTGKLQKDSPSSYCYFCKEENLATNKSTLEHRTKDCHHFEYKKEANLIKEIKQLTKIALPRNV